MTLELKLEKWEVAMFKKKSHYSIVQWKKYWKIQTYSPFRIALLNQIHISWWSGRIWILQIFYWYVMQGQGCRERDDQIYGCDTTGLLLLFWLCASPKERTLLLMAGMTELIKSSPQPPSGLLSLCKAKQAGTVVEQGYYRGCIDLLLSLSPS